MKESFQTWQRWVGMLSGIIIVIALITQGGELLGMPARVSILEKGQTELMRRVDSFGADIKALQKDTEKDSARTRESFESMISSMAKISGALQDLRDSSIANTTKLAETREKAIQAAITAADAKAKADQIEVEHKVGKDK